jgi:hypothetical protein
MAAVLVALGVILIDPQVVAVLEVTPELEELDQLVLVVTDPQGQEVGLAVVALEILLALRHFLGNGPVV